MAFTKLIYFLLFSFVVALAGCGDATVVKAYQYNTTKENLEKTVKNVIQSNPAIVLDKSPETVIVRRHPDDKKDTATVTIKLSDFHSPDSAQVASFYKGQFKISIKDGNSISYFTLRYLGDERDWKRSTTSTIFISEARDDSGNKISQGHNENGQFKSKLAREFTELFERNVVDNVDKALRLKHTII